MADYGAQDTSTTTLGANQFPISEAWTPNAGFSAVEGGTQTTDAGGKKSAPVRVEVKDGSDLTQGAQADAAYTSGSGSIISILKGIFTKLAGTLTISGAVTTSGTVTEANSAASKTDLDTIVTNTNKIPASPATEGGHLATIDTSTANANTAIGTKTDSKATDGSTTAWSVIALLKGIIDKLLATLAVTQSGTWTVQPGNTANTTAWKVDGSGVTQPVSGTVTANQGGTWTVQPGNTANTTPWLTSPQAASSGGSIPYHNLSAATTNFTNVKGAACQMYGCDLSNTSASIIFVKFYDKATLPATTDVPKRTIQVPANATVIRAFPVGLKFAAGFGWAATGAVADNDNTAIAANCVVDFDLNS